jgi:hypothetical protein
MTVAGRLSLGPCACASRQNGPEVPRPCSAKTEASRRIGNAARGLDEATTSPCCRDFVILLPWNIPDRRLFIPHDQPRPEPMTRGLLTELVATVAALTVVGMLCTIGVGLVVIAARYFGMP